MTEPRTRWNDDRLDDLAGSVQVMRDLPQAVAKIGVRMDDARDDVNRLGSKVQSYIDEQRDVEKQRRRDRKSDFRWVVGTVLASASLVIAALALFVGKF